MTIIYHDMLLTKRSNRLYGLSTRSLHLCNAMVTGLSISGRCSEEDSYQDSKDNTSVATY